MNIVVNEELRAFIDPLTPEEHEALERSLLAEGCRDALVLWGEVLVDGHNRYGICQKHGLPFRTVQNPRFKSLEDVQLWMIDQHLGRRSVSDFQRGLLALRKKEIVAARRSRLLDEGAATSRALAAAGDPAGADASPALASEDSAADPGLPPQPALNSRESVARAARISASQVQQIETIRAKATPELVAAVKAGEVSLNAAAVVASLPAEEQAAAVAGGRSELRQAAKRVRESRARPTREKEVNQPAADAGADPATAPLNESEAEELQRLRVRVAELVVENGVLRQQLAALQR